MTFKSTESDWKESQSSQHYLVYIRLPPLLFTKKYISDAVVLSQKMTCDAGYQKMNPMFHATSNAMFHVFLK